MDKNNLLPDTSLLEKFFSGETTEDENCIIYEWINKSSENRTEFTCLKQAWDELAMRLIPKANLEEDYAKLVQAISSTQAAKKRALWLRVSAIAAGLLVLLAASYFLLTSQSKSSKQLLASIAVPNGQQEQVMLPDGTKVWVNAGSQLDYLFNKATKTREAYLKGEAYFEVAHNKEQPFVVHADGIDIRVLGTKFNVTSYANERYTEAAVAEGLVVVSSGTSSAVELKPNTKLVFDKESKQVRVEDVNASTLTFWTVGYIVFKEQPLGEIAKKLERLFDVQISFNDEEIKKHSYTATFEQNMSITEILHILQLTAPISYTITNQHIAISSN